VHEETAIARQERSILAAHYVEQLAVISVLLIRDIKPQETQIARESSQMSISDKPRNSSSLQSFLRGDRASVFNRENIYFCIVGQRVIKTDWLSVDQNQIYLRVRKATRLNDVFYGRLFRELPLDYCVARFCPEKKMEVTVKAKPDCEWVHVNLRFARWRMRTQR
jgi:hypothetical protein